MNSELQMFKLGLEKAEEPVIRSLTSTGSSKKQEFQKNIYFCFIDYAKAFASQRKVMSASPRSSVGLS